MKDITDYFSSPTKVRKSSEQVDKIKSTQTSPDQNVNIENKVGDKNSEKFAVSKDKLPKRTKKKRKRKPTDPEVKDVTELLSNNLSLISPNTSGTQTLNSPSSVEKKSKKIKHKGPESSVQNAIHGNDKSDENFSKVSTGKNDAENVKTKHHANGKPNKSSKTNLKETNKNDREALKTSEGAFSSELKLITSNVIEIIDTESNSETPKEASKVNAFQFMMNSRNNIIGQNSNGKTASEQDDSVGIVKTKLGARKDLFKNWADHKGALKRKREEEEIEKCISHKMEKRRKRLKKLLCVKTENREEIVKKKKTPLKTKKSIKIQSNMHSSSDSENSIHFTKTESSNQSKSIQLGNVSEVIEENAQDAVLTISSPCKKHHKENGQNSLLNFFGVLSKEPQDEKIEVFEDLLKEPAKELIRIKMFTPESTKKRTSLLSLNKDRAKSISDESRQEFIKAKKHRKKKKKHQDIEQTLHSEAQLNDSLEDFCSPEAKVDTSVKRSIKKQKLKKHDRKKKEKDKDHHSKIIANNVVGQEVERCEEISINDLMKEWDSENEMEIQKTSRIPIIKEDVLIDESTKDSDIVQTKKKRSTKLCTLTDDSNDSTISEGRHLAIENSTPQSSVIRSKTKSKICSTDKKLKAKFKRQAKSHIIESEAEESIVMTPNTEKKNNIKTKGGENDFKDIKILINDHLIISADSEPQCRVLRPKRTNVNYTECRNERLKTPKAKTKDKSVEKVDLSSESDYEDDFDKTVSVKVAPVFLKATPKPKLDPEVVEARKKFLMSGVPDSLKKTVEKQKSIEDKEYDVFPSVSHIQQKCQSQFWDLPKLNVKYVASTTPFNPNEQDLTFYDLIAKKTPYEVNITTEIETVKHIKTLLDIIKVDNPHYPVYKAFRHIYEKSGKNLLKEKKLTRRRSKKDARKSLELVESSINCDAVLKDCEMWSEKYKPRTSEEILGNNAGVTKLKNWLQTWMNYSEEITARGKRKRTNSNSESEFETTDCDSRDSTRFPGNTMILWGPCGSGKTSAVYAIANELGFNVLELNASSKRTGKRLVQELQEATQSHQVRKNSIMTLTNSEKALHKGLKNKKTELKDEKTDQQDKKMCILLIEDVDLVFDQDDGFLTSLSQLITTSKRPIILTTTDNSPAHVQKLIAQHEYISFMPLSMQCLGVWLQILCLIEGLLVDKDDLGNLLEYNKGDIRKTVLEVQFWSQSGGQLEKSRVFPLKSLSSRFSTKSDLKQDEDLKIDLTEGDDKEDYFVHKHCIGSFEVLRENKEYTVPRHLNLGLLWWNIPNILSVPSYAKERLHRSKTRSRENENEQTNDKDENNLKSVLRLYDALTFSDSLFKTVYYHASNEPVIKNWFGDVRDSLELTERKEDLGMNGEMVHELTHTLVNGCIENYRSIDGTECGFNMALPDTHERRWRAKQHICEDFLKEPIPIWNSLDRSSIALDYLPTLRDIARYEDKRAASNTKRGNRFRHYLKNLNIDFKESTCKLACNVLHLSDN